MGSTVDKCLKSPKNQKSCTINCIRNENNVVVANVVEKRLKIRKILQKIYDKVLQSLAK